MLLTRNLVRYCILWLYFSLSVYCRNKNICMIICLSFSRKKELPLMYSTRVHMVLETSISFLCFGNVARKQAVFVSGVFLIRLLWVFLFHILHSKTSFCNLHPFIAIHQLWFFWFSFIIFARLCYIFLLSFWKSFSFILSSSILLFHPFCFFMTILSFSQFQTLS